MRGGVVGRMNGVLLMMRGMIRVGRRTKGEADDVYFYNLPINWWRGTLSFDQFL